MVPWLTFPTLWLCLTCSIRAGLPTTSGYALVSHDDNGDALRVFTQQLDKGKAPVAAYEHAHDYDYDYDYDYDEDQEVEDFFMSSAAGRARIVLGNRRFGDGGYVSSGRRNARPVQQPSKVCRGPQQDMLGTHVP